MVKQSTSLLCVSRLVTHHRAIHHCDARNMHFSYTIDAVSQSFFPAPIDHSSASPLFVVDHTIEDAPVWDAASSGSHSHNLRAESPCFYKRRRTVRADTCCLANDPDS
ncbi:hypothetical protein TNCV_4016951 [Trichonephila clavipes]|nr:hypothetical protein TNCV_4016951 [Trichonephila clavipes]